VRTVRLQPLAGPASMPGVRGARRARLERPKPNRLRLAFRFARPFPAFHVREVPAEMPVSRTHSLIVAVPAMTPVGSSPLLWERG
jgi:hypothetical protein